MTCQYFHPSVIFFIELNDQILVAFECYFFRQPETVLFLEQSSVLKVVSLVVFINSFLRISQNDTDIEVKSIV